MRSKRILITAGPTQEALDPVRFISNFSTGRMGYCIAEAAKKAGHRVTLLTGPTSLKVPSKVKAVSFTSGEDLGGKLLREFKKADVLFMTAAICDYAPAKVAPQKIKRGQKISLKLKATPDLLKKLIPHKRRRQCIVGFCLETDHLEKKAKRKLKEKELDAIVGNFVSPKYNPFGEGKTSVLVLDKNGDRIWLDKKRKKEIARFLIKQFCSF